MKQSIVWRLLRHNISAKQLAGYAIANLLGLTIVVAALQFYSDIKGIWNDDDSFISRDYIIISRKVSGIGSIFRKDATNFSETDIAEIERQPWARRVGKFTASGFNVSANVEMGGCGLSTALFLEAIPSEFFDIIPDGWSYSPADSSATVPIILSKDYLTLYNFGFASARGLPQISEGMISMLPLRLSISGNGRQRYFKARIAGFSSRLNTIAVPEEFMTWANANFSEKNSTDPSRLIIEVSSPGDPAITDFLDNNGYESAGDKADNGRASYFLAVSTAVVITIGAVISLLAFFILLLSIDLLLQKNRRVINLLLMQGYTPGAVGRYYTGIVLTINSIVTVGAIALMLCVRLLWKGQLSSIGIEGASPLIAISAAVIIMAAITFGNIRSITGTINRIFPRPGRR